jgi:hypothetical protein
MSLVTGLGKEFGLSKQALESLEGKAMDQICHNGFWVVASGRSHCAHFVSHVLGVSTGGTCRAMGDRPTGWGASMRLDEVYRACPLRGFWEARPRALLTCLAFVVLQKKRPDGSWQTQVRAHGSDMNYERYRHVGIYLEGNVWHFYNGGKQVVAEPLKHFRTRYESHGPADLLFGSLPSRTC